MQQQQQHAAQALGQQPGGGVGGQAGESQRTFLFCFVTFRGDIKHKSKQNMACELIGGCMVFWVPRGF